ncbi:transposase [Desulfopila sp. IMCC35008]|uniref:transposase n=1 Tax=Desulfopila sp. IMCC35008 TaxID=2653858 RepID=UPI0035176F3F
MRSITGVGQFLALGILNEVHDIKSFPRAQDCSSYARLIKPSKRVTQQMSRDSLQAKYYVSFLKISHIVLP